MNDTANKPKKVKEKSISGGAASKSMTAAQAKRLAGSILSSDFHKVSRKSLSGKLLTSRSSTQSLLNSKKPYLDSTKPKVHTEISPNVETAFEKSLERYSALYKRFSE